MDSPANSEMSSQEDIGMSACLSVFEPYVGEPTRSCFPAFEVQDRFGSYSEEGITVSEQVERPEWCSCGACSRMETEVEELCCKDVAPIRERLQSIGDLGLGCIADHPGFHEVCLATYAMEAYLNEYIDTNGPLGDDEEIHRVYRFLAYRKFTFWIWKRLGRNNRRVIPSCAVVKIRKCFPSEVSINIDS